MITQQYPAARRAIPFDPDMTYSFDPEFHIECPACSKGLFHPEDHQKLLYRDERAARFDCVCWHCGSRFIAELGGEDFT